VVKNLTGISILMYTIYEACRLCLQAYCYGKTIAVFLWFIHRQKFLGLFYLTMVF